MAVLNVYVCKDEHDANMKAETVRRQGAKKIEIIPNCDQVSLYDSKKLNDEKTIYEHYGQGNDFIITVMWD